MPGASGLRKSEDFEWVSWAQRGKSSPPVFAADFRFSACKQTHVKRDPERPLTGHVVIPQPSPRLVAPPLEAYLQTDKEQ